MARAIARPPDAELEKWYEIIRAAGDPERLRGRLSGRDCARDTLWHICNDHNLHRAGNKSQLAMAIVEWVSVLCSLITKLVIDVGHSAWIRLLR